MSNQQTQSISTLPHSSQVSGKVETFHFLHALFSLSFRVNDEEFVTIILLNKFEQKHTQTHS